MPNTIKPFKMSERIRFSCPITNKIYKDPVLLEDGYYYERSAITKWFEDGNEVSPMTGNKYRNKLMMKCHDFDNQLLDYKAGEEYNNKIKDEELYMKITSYIKSKQYEKFLEIDEVIKNKNFNIKAKESCIKEIFSSYPEVVKYFTINNITISCEKRENENSHHIFLYGSDELIKWYINYLKEQFENNTDMINCVNQLVSINIHSKRPIHLYCSRSDISLKMFKFICHTYKFIFKVSINKLFDYYRFNPLHYVCINCKDDKKLMDIIDYWLYELSYELEDDETVSSKWEKNVIDLVYKNKSLGETIKDYLFDIYILHKYGLEQDTVIRINGRVLTTTTKKL